MCLACDAPGLSLQAPPRHLAGGESFTKELFESIIRKNQSSLSDEEIADLAAALVEPFLVDLQDVDRNPIYVPEPDYRKRVVLTYATWWEQS